MSHVRLAAKTDSLHAARVASGQADLLLGCDLMVAANKDAMGLSSSSRTVAAVNTNVPPTGNFARNPDWQGSGEGLLAQVKSNVHVTHSIDAARLATALMGDAVATNVFMLGFAWQKGLVPLQEASLMRAIELNGTAVAMNKAAFAWGRQASIDRASARVAAGVARAVTITMMPRAPTSLTALLKDRTARLTAYQNRGYAARYEAFVREMARMESGGVGGDRVTRVIASSLYKLMAYKDEYEVARLHAKSDFFDRINRQFEGAYKIRFHLAPPLFAKRDHRGHLIKQEFGPWMGTVFKILAKGKFLRGSAFDPFGYSTERREERDAIANFERLMRRVMSRLSTDQLETAISLAHLPQSVRGFGHVKKRNARLAQEQETRLVEAFFNTATPPSQHAA